ncbi:MAG: efflux RND transporter periplasmic adaptor subunit [Bacteroidales bacterium]|nr:efflux RND transporter periplasmic adaptor subunit [Bacteroidales bacterium]
MKKNRTSIINFGLIVLAGTLISCQHTATGTNKAAFVKTKSVAATSATFYNEIKGFGTLQAINSLDLEAKFDGIVHFNNLKEKIKKGEIVYTLVGPEIALKREDLKKAYDNAKIQYDYLKKYYEAQKKLLNKNYLSRIDFENAAKDFQNAQNILNTTEYDLNYFKTMTSFRAPFDGFLDNIQVPQGEDAVTGQLLGTFQNDNYLKLGAAYYGNPDSLSSKEFLIRINGQTFQGKLIYKEKAINPSSGGHTLWVSLKDPKHQLKSGEYVSFSFLGKKRESVAVPHAAIIEKESKYFVITLKNGKYYRTPVETGQEKDGLTEIKSGLKIGDQVLTQGVFEVFYGNLTKSMNVAD